jgi:L-fucose isomerase-like protein
MTMGVVVGNRGFFPSHLATSGRLEMIAALEAVDIKAIVLTPEETAHGAVETYEDAKKCAALFKKHADHINGIIITLPNFGEERGLADTLRLANLQVPVLIQATPDSTGKMGIAFRRDSFCGKMSICNNLKQYGIPYSLTRLHAEAPDSIEFKADLQWFSAVCRIVRGLKNVRFGAIGARPTAFNTVRYSENSSRNQASPSKHSTSARSWAHREIQRQRRRRAGQARRHQEVHPHPRHA